MWCGPKGKRRPEEAIYNAVKVARSAAGEETHALAAADGKDPAAKALRKHRRSHNGAPMLRRCAGFVWVSAGALMLAACASQFANSYLGKDSVALELENGKPVNIVELPNGMRSFQYYWGGESVVIPGTGVAGLGSPGCLINFIAERHGDRWVVVKAKWPDRLIC